MHEAGGLHLLSTIRVPSSTLHARSHSDMSVKVCSVSSTRLSFTDRTLKELAWHLFVTSIIA